MTRTLPTDRHGRVYYGPKTVAQIRECLDDCEAFLSESERKDVLLAAKRAGYVRAAQIVAKACGINLS